MTKSTSLLTLALFLLLAPVNLSAQNAPGSQEPSLAPPPAAAPQKAVKPVEGQIVLQNLNTMLASRIIGADVYSPTDQWIGDVNDLIVDTKGTLQGVVIGVGGVMGIGEKEVAFEMAKLTFIPSQ